MKTTILLIAVLVFTVMPATASKKNPIEYREDLQYFYPMGDNSQGNIIPVGTDSTEVAKILKGKGIDLAAIEATAESFAVYYTIGGQRKFRDDGIFFDGVSKDETLKILKKFSGDFWKIAVAGELEWRTLPRHSEDRQSPIYAIGHKKAGKFNSLTYMYAGFNIDVLAADIEIARSDGQFQMITGFVDIRCGNFGISDISPPYEKEDEEIPKIDPSDEEPEVIDEAYGSPLEIDTGVDFAGF